VSDFSQYLLHPENRKQLSFLLRESGYAPDRPDFPPSGWRHRRAWAEFEDTMLEEARRRQAAAAASAPADSKPEADAPPLDPYRNSPQGLSPETKTPHRLDRTKEQHAGMVLGIAISTIRGRDSHGDVRDFYLCRPGDDVEVIFPSAGAKPEPVNTIFTVVDLYESKMSEYDATFAFVPLRKLQDLRGMIDPETGVASVTSIQIKLKPGADLNAARDKLRAAFPPDTFPFQIETWRDMQGPLLSAVRMETTILNILLFLIIAVAGFGILATFFMIVVEKTRDIGIPRRLVRRAAGS
jgi:lipoprotein-releasing system permease protein